MDDRIDDAQLDELDAIEARAAAAPWYFDSWSEDEDLESGYAHIKECDVLEPTGIQFTHDYDGYWHDWRCLIAARNALPKLIAEIRRLKRELAGGTA